MASSPRARLPATGTEAATPDRLIKIVFDIFFSSTY